MTQPKQETQDLVCMWCDRDLIDESEYTYELHLHDSAYCREAENALARHASKEAVHG